MAKTKKNSRDKGGRGERAAAKELRDWWGTDFARTPLSGGFGTAKFRADWNAAGDLVTPDPSFPFCVEVKWQEDWHMEQLIKNDGCKVFSWWAQARDECPPDKLPLLVFKRNHHPWYVMIEEDDMPGTVQGDLNARFFTVRLSEDITGTYPMTVYIFTLEDFSSTEPDKWKKAKENLVADRQDRLKYKEVMQTP